MTEAEAQETLRVADRLGFADLLRIIEYPCEGGFAVIAPVQTPVPGDEFADQYYILTDYHVSVSEHFEGRGTPKIVRMNLPPVTPEER